MVSVLPDLIRCRQGPALHFHTICTVFLPGPFRYYSSALSTPGYRRATYTLHLLSSFCLSFPLQPSTPRHRRFSYFVRDLSAFPSPFCYRPSLYYISSSFPVTQVCALFVLLGSFNHSLCDVPNTPRCLLLCFLVLTSLTCLILSALCRSSPFPLPPLLIRRPIDVLHTLCPVYPPSQLPVVGVLSALSPRLVSSTIVSRLRHPIVLSPLVYPLIFVLSAVACIPWRLLIGDSRTIAGPRVRYQQLQARRLQ